MRVIDFIGDWLRGKASDLHKDVAEQGTLSPHLTQTRDRDLKTLAAPSCREQRPCDREVSHPGGQICHWTSAMHVSP